MRHTVAATLQQPSQAAPHCQPRSSQHVRGSRMHQQQLMARCSALAAPLPPPRVAAAAAAADSLLQRISLAASTLSGEQTSRERQEKLVGMGAAIRALQQDLPAVLDHEPTLEVYAEGVVFEDRLSPRLGLPSASCVGREHYARLLWSLRFHRTLFFAKAKVELVRMWEREEGVVCVRWSARAAPRLLDGLVPTRAAGHVALDGVSEFEFNDRGLIQRHTVDCVQYTGLQLQLPLLARTARPQHAMVPGLAGGSCDE